MNPLVVSYCVNIWSCLESSRGLTAVAASWRERLGVQSDTFRSAFLQRAPGVAKGMPCPRGCACTHEIIVTSDECQVSSGEGKAKSGAEAFPSPHPMGRGIKGEGSPPTINAPPSTIRAVCRCDPPNCPDIPLTPEDIVLLELSWTKISRALCHVFELDYKPVDLGLLNTRQIGSWSSGAVPVVLTIQHDRAWFRTVILELIARLRRNFILLAPTSKNLDAVGQELLASSNAACFSLDANVALTSGGTLVLTSARAPGELFRPFSPQPREAEASLASRVLALVQQLETEEARKGPSVLKIFRMYCIEGLSAATIARKCSCSRMTVRQRLRLIEARTGMEINQLRKVSAHLDETEATFADSRASHIHRKNLIYDDDDTNEN